MAPIGIFAYGAATPTDLSPIEDEYVEIADDDFGHIEGIEPRVFIIIEPKQVAMYDEVTFRAILMDFPDDYTIYWEYSTNQEDWSRVEGEHEITYTFVITPDNYDLWWRVCVEVRT
jgi:hypothetical protein